MLLCVCSLIDAEAQEAAWSLRSTVSAWGGSTGDVPFWMYANRSGRVVPGGTQLVATAAAVRPLDDAGWFGYGGGADVTVRGGEAPTAHFTELYGQARAAFLVAEAGRRIETYGTTAERLSMGSLATSLNATPIPKIMLRTADYVEVPFSRGYAAFKGHLAHGWFLDDRFVDRPYLHQKSFYVRLGGGLPVNVYGGIVHDAFWGGTSPTDDGELPDGLNDWLRTMLGMSGASDAPGGEQLYVQGNHLGIYDLGATVRLQDYDLLVYRQFLFDDKDGLKLKNPGDGLLGVSIARRDGGWVSRVLYEYLYTKRQSGSEPVGPGRDGPGGQDNYYNHYIYRSGWTHYGRTVGIPLMLPYPDGAILVHSRIMNNRIVAHHLGVEGEPTTGFTYRLLATYSRNYGLYEEVYPDGVPIPGGGPEVWNPGLEQVSLLAEAEWSVPGTMPVSVTGGIAVDAGAVYADAVGLQLGLVYRPSLPRQR